MAKIFVMILKIGRFFKRMKAYSDCYIDSEDKNLLDENRKCPGRADPDFGVFPCNRCRFWNGFQKNVKKR